MNSYDSISYHCRVIICASILIHRYHSTPGCLSAYKPQFSSLILVLHHPMTTMITNDFHCRFVIGLPPPPTRILTWHITDQATCRLQTSSFDLAFVLILKMIAFVVLDDMQSIMLP